MKKKIVMAIAVLGMAFAGQVTAQNDSKLIGGGGGGDDWTTYYDYPIGGGVRLSGCWGPATNCLPEVVITNK